MIIVEPAVFEIVAFDGAEIAAQAAAIADVLGCADLLITIVIDEATPMTRSSIESVDPIVIGIEAGAIEDPRRIRHLQLDRLREVVSRQLLGALDRRDPRFADADGDDRLSLSQRTAWDVHIAGRLHRLGFPVGRARWEHRFTLGHRPGPATEVAFATLWDTDRLTWAQIDAISAAVRPEPTATQRLVR
ncbi:MAG: hypothetical protein AB7V43_18175 [Acidimicrobiia bacterium]